MYHLQHKQPCCIGYTLQTQLPQLCRNNLPFSGRRQGVLFDLSIVSVKRYELHHYY